MVKNKAIPIEARSKGQEKRETVKKFKINQRN